MARAGTFPDPRVNGFDSELTDEDESGEPWDCDGGFPEDADTEDEDE